jgi:hypothetical protein
MATASQRTVESEASIFARFFDDENGEMPEEVARFILTLGFTDKDKTRMHDLAVRNQEDALSSDEREELIAFGRVGDLVAILKSKARRRLGIKLEKPKGL